MRGHKLSVAFRPILIQNSLKRQKLTKIIFIITSENANHQYLTYLLNTL